MAKDIAVIGMAGRFPGARDVNELYANLREGVDSVSSISQERIENTTLPPKGSYINCGYLDDLHHFDYGFFNFSPAEAQAMDPHQRLLLQCVYNTIENAGYNPRDFRKSNTAVIAADADLNYYKLADDYEPSLSTGNTNAFLASQIARCFDLRGGMFVIDTTCSSSLVALHMACKELITEDADCALVCGAHLVLFPFKSDVGLDLESSDGKSRAFSAKANGMSVGEAVASVLLKPLDKALEDKDTIHAVIKGSAINNNAAASASITAPDSERQADVILKAWNKAGVFGRDLGFIEVHGSGTELGDNIEVGGLNLAFRKHELPNEKCSISTIKSNIGHTRTVAGLTSFIKTILSLKHKVLFPNIHFDEPNPLIDFENSHVRVQTHLENWNVENGKKRIAGVSSMGLSGTNCHIVLEEPTLRSSLKKDSKGLITLSSKSEEGLKAQKQLLRNFLLENPKVNLSDLGYTLCVGREHHEHRFAVVVSDIIELKDSLGSEVTEKFLPKKEPQKTLILLTDPDEQWSGEIQKNLYENYEEFRINYDKCLYRADNKDLQTVQQFVFLFSFYNLLGKLGIDIKNVLPLGMGKIVASVINGQNDLEEGLALATEYHPSELSNLKCRVEKLVEREVQSDPVVIINIGGEDDFYNTLKEQSSLHENLKLFGFSGAIKGPIQELFKWLYLQNASINWSDVYIDQDLLRLELPGYQFDKKKCWIRNGPKHDLHLEWTVTSDVEKNIDTTSHLSNDIQKKLVEAWSEVLGNFQYSPQDNFFEVGGDSLKATKVINLIEREFNLQLDFEDIFDFPTLESLATYIDENWDLEQRLNVYFRNALGMEKIGINDDFFELGGQSIIANRVVNRIAKDLNLRIDFEIFFQNPTVSKLSQYINQTNLKSGQSSTIQQAPEQPHYDLAPNQKGLWLECQLQGGVIAYNQPNTYKIEGRITKQEVEIIFEHLVKRHDALRTSFQVIDGEPRLVINRPEEAMSHVGFLDMTDVHDKWTKAADHLREKSAQLFDLTKCPLFAVELITMSEGAHLLFINFHHLIVDGWSMRILEGDFFEVLQALRANEQVQLQPLPFQYKDYAYWQHTSLDDEKLELADTFWQNEFRDPVPALNLPTKKEREGRKGFGEEKISLDLNSMELNTLKNLVLQTNSSLFVVLVSFIKLILYKVTGQRDIVIGTTLSGRSNSHFEGTVGHFVNVLPLRTKIDTDQGISEMIHNVRDKVFKLVDLQFYTLIRLIKLLGIKRSKHKNMLYDVVVVMQNTTYLNGEPDAIEGLEITEYTDYKEAGFSMNDLRIEFIELPEGLTMNMYYNKHLFQEATINELKHGFLQVLDIVKEDSKTPILKLLTEDSRVESERDKMIDDFFDAKF